MPPSLLANLRVRRARTISRDPVSVVVTRTIKHRGPGRAQAPTISTLAAQTVRLFIRRNADTVPMPSGVEPGLYLPSRRFGLMALWTADFRAGTDTLDEFDAAGFGHFEVRSVVPNTHGAGAYGLTVECELVSN